MSRGYGKYRRGGGSHATFQFENLFKENSNRPSAARSAATVGKWGVTSFTSIRTVNGKFLTFTMSYMHNLCKNVHWAEIMLAANF